MKPIALGLAVLLLASCGTSPASSNPVSSNPGQSSSQEEPSSVVSTLKSLDDAPNIPSGMYIKSKQVYDLKKEDKKLICYDFGMDYNKLKAKDGTIVFDVSINFVEYGKFGPAVSYVVDNKPCYLYINSLGRFAEDRYTISGDQMVVTSAELAEMPTFIEPTYGSYVSDKQTQNKVDAQGNYIPDATGGYVKEDFYLFLDLTASSAKIYVGENETTHRDLPLHEVNDYTLSYNAGGLNIKVPHKDGEFSCSLTITSARTISFVNSMERKGDYSCSGTFTVILDY